MAVTWDYNGSDTLIAVCTGLPPSTDYDLYSNDPDSGIPSGTSDGSGALSLTATGIGGEGAGDTLYAEVHRHSGDSNPVACIINKFGTASTTDQGIAATWTYDGVGGGTGVVTCTFDSVNEFTYELVVNGDTGGGVTVVGDGTSKTLTYSTLDFGTETSFDALLGTTAPLVDDSAITLFVSGVASTGSQDLTGATPPPTFVSGVSIAFDATALDPSATFTRIDNVPGVNVATINIKRGRPDARSKTSVGTATITGFDLVGDTDPTNSTGPWYGELDPVKQAQVQLFNPVAETWSPIFTGYTSDWTHTLDVSEKKLDFDLELSDLLDLLNDAEIIPDQAGNTVPQESIGDCFYTGQHIDDRLLAVLADASTGLLAQVWPDVILEGDGGQIASGNVFVQGRTYANKTTLLQVVDEACDAESPGATNRFITTDGVFAFRGRYYRYTPDFYLAIDGVRSSNHRLRQWAVGDVPASLEDDTLAVYTGLTFTRGKTNLINASLVTPIGIAQDDISAQFVSNGTSVSKYGPRTEGTSYEDIITGDADDGNGPLQETKSFGQATVDNYKDPVTRVSQLIFKNPPAGTASAQAAATWDLLCNIELSDLVTVTSTHPGGGGFIAADHFVEGITYQLAPFRGDEWEVTLTLDLSPRDYFATMPDSWSPPIGDPDELEADFTVSE